MAMNIDYDRLQVGALWCQQEDDAEKCSYRVEFRDSERRHRLTIRYLDQYGMELRPARRKSCIEGLMYFIEPLVIEGAELKDAPRGVNLHADKTLRFHYYRKSSKSK